MNINWKVRFKNKNFWLALIPAVLLLATQICALFGVELEVAGLSDQLAAIVTSVFAVLAILGIVNDPTTKGFLSDSSQAMSYTEPKGDD
ncbi:MAG: phage holin [Bacteroidaceae bacterium]|nr:phage holin [Bacteroidaceae bacterium]